MKRCVVAPLTEHSGNVSTALRLARFCEAALVDCASVSQTVKCDTCLLLHAYRSGRAVFPSVFNETFPPCVEASRFILIFGGTDVNEFTKLEAERSMMEVLIGRVNAVVCFGSSLLEEAKKHWPSLLQSVPVFVVPQGVENLVGESLSAIISNALLSSGCSSVALLPGGLRKVKDPMFVVNAWKCVNRDVLLLLVGPALEVDVVRDVQSADQKNVVWCGGIARQEFVDMLKDPRVTCVLNSSTSEGQPQSVLEAMSAEKLVVARRIAANVELVEGNPSHGLLFSTKDELVEILNSPLVHPELISAAKVFVSQSHSLEKERMAYLSIIAFVEQ